jgi:four helix bundle protein
MVTDDNKAELESRRTIQCFEDLRVWQKGIAFVKCIYEKTAAGKFSKDFALRHQLRRAGISIPANIAEGFERASRKEYLQFLNIVGFSLATVEVFIWISLQGSGVMIVSRRLPSKVSGKIHRKANTHEPWPPPASCPHFPICPFLTVATRAPRRRPVRRPPGR